MKQTASVVKLSRILSWIIAIVLSLLPLHPLLTVWVGFNVGHLDLIRIWKDILIVAMLPFVLWLAIHENRSWSWLLNSWIARLFAAYTLLHFVLGFWALSQNEVDKSALIYGLIINLRFVYFFIVCAVVSASSGLLINNWRRIVLWPGLIVVTLGLLQKFVLPYDFLRHFGYGTKTIPAYQTVDSNLDYQRLQSSLRGANPLGAYLVLIITSLVVFLKRKTTTISLLVGAALVVLYFSYSRSAWIGLALSLIVLIWLRASSLRPGKLALAVFIFLVMISFGLYLGRSNQIVQDSLFHTSSISISSTSSNQVRSLAIKNGLNDISQQPLGRGPGTAGPASFRNIGHSARIAEDYYLQIGQEVGIEGLALFLAILLLVAHHLWLSREEVLAQILLASLVGISFINFVSHAWTDDTLSLLWWGLAGIACSPAIITARHKKDNGQKIKKS